jgi:hypothetical protein
MGIFSKKTDTVPVEQAPPATYNNAPHGHHTTRHSTDVSPPGGRRRGFLSRRRSSSISSSDEEMRRIGHGLTKNSRHSTSSNDPMHAGSRTSTGGGGLFHRNRDPEDPSISAARERVQMAEQAEADAERALMYARESVQDARQHVKNLEVEAQEDARRAKLKQQSAKEISKMGSKLGRKF